MKRILLVLLLISGSVSAQNLEISAGASLTIENGASIKIAGLNLSPDAEFIINGENTITKSSTPIVTGNTSIDRVYSNGFSIDGFTGGMTLFYEDIELNAIDETKLALEVNELGFWNSYVGAVDTSLNTISYNFDTPINFLGITAASSDAALPVDDFENELNITVFPNPATNQINISGNLDVKIEVYNVLGKKVLTSKSKTFNISNLPTGTYFMKVTEVENAKTNTYKFIKR